MNGKVIKQQQSSRTLSQLSIAKILTPYSLQRSKQSALIKTYP